MWYEDSYNQSIQVIKNANKKLSQKEYRIIAKEKNLLSPECLKFITRLQFIELVNRTRK